MREYNRYMDKISVTSILHEKIMLRPAVKPKYRPIMIRRTAAFACLAVVLLGVLTIQKLTQQNLTPAQGYNPSVLYPGSSKYTLYFNKADSQPLFNIAIRGHFWQELTNQELGPIFPELTGTHSITATANVQSDTSGASLFNIDSLAVSAAGLKTYIQLAPDEVVLDYGFDVKTKTSDVSGTAVTAGYFETNPNSKGLRKVIYFATFKLSDVAYYVELGGAEAEKEALKNEISGLIGLLVEGGAADLEVFHPVVPELREDRLNLDEAQEDPDFGAYLPAILPDGFVFEDALRFINQERNELIVHWANSMGYIDWHVSVLDESSKERITTIGDTRNYDLSLYPIPRADSVPSDLREIVDNPIFLSEELTLEALRVRTYEVLDSGDEEGPRMRFGVLYGDTLVELHAKGAASETVFEILQQIKIQHEGNIGRGVG